MNYITGAMRTGVSLHEVTKEVDVMMMTTHLVKVFS